MVVSGMPEGVGKSAYVNHVIADVLGYQKAKSGEEDVDLRFMWDRKDKVLEKNPDAKLWSTDWEATKLHIKYPPDEVVTFLMDLIERGIRISMFHWDDAGTWLNTMDFQDPFVVAFMKFLSLARTVTGAVVLSTPVEEWVLKKLRTAIGIYHIIVKKKPSTDRRYVFRPRLATCYKARKYKGNPKTYFPRKWIDEFRAIMPDTFYHWYKPKRDYYAKLSVQLMKKALEYRKQRGWLRQAKIDEQIVEKIDTRIHKANEESKDFEELLATLEK